MIDANAIYAASSAEFGWDDAGAIVHKGTRLGIRKKHLDKRCRAVRASASYSCDDLVVTTLRRHVEQFTGSPHLPEILFDSEVRPHAKGSVVRA